MQNGNTNQCSNVHIVCVLPCPMLFCQFLFFFMCDKGSRAFVRQAHVWYLTSYCHITVQTLQYWYNGAVFLNQLKLCEEQGGFQSNTFTTLINVELSLAKHRCFLCKSWLYQKMFQFNAKIWKEDSLRSVLPMAEMG